MAKLCQLGPITLCSNGFCVAYLSHYWERLGLLVNLTEFINECIRLK